MRTFAQEESHDHRDLRSPRNTDALAEIPPLVTSRGSWESTIFRKASCTCGGGCPACQSRSALHVSHPYDPAEIEADQIADHVMQMSIDDPKPKSGFSNQPNAIRRKCDTCEEEEIEADESPVMRKEAFASAVPTPPPSDTPPSIKNVINSGGQPLDHEIRSFFEPRFGTDLSHIRIHADSAAGESARSINARAYTFGNNIVFGSNEYRPASGPTKLLAHELAHTTQQGLVPAKLYRDLFSDLNPFDPSAGGGYDAAQRRRDELEAAETGPGRQQTLDRLAGMSDQDARREAPGIAYRAQDRGDTELAIVAADRLLRVWIASTDLPVVFTAFGPDDNVDALLDRAQHAFAEAELQLGGKYLAIAMVQLVRAATATVARRMPPDDDPALAVAFQMTLFLQRAAEQDIADRIQRARLMIETQSQALTERNIQAEIDAFEAIAESVFAAERQAGPAIPEDLGTGGSLDQTAPPAARGRGGPRSGRSHEPTATAESATPPPRPEPTPEAPVSRADESIVNSTHPDLEGALVFHSVNPQNTYANIRSPRYAVAGTLAGAHRLANELFGRRSSVVVEEIFVRDPQDATRRQIRYLVLALSVRLNPPETSRGEGGQVIGFENIQMLSRPAARQYYFLTVVSGPWQFFVPTLLHYIRGIHASEQDVQAQQLSPEQRRDAVFSPVEDLINQGETQEAANQLSYVGSEGFALVDTATKIRFLVTMLEAFTFEAHEQTVVEVFRSLSGPAELREVLGGLRDAGVLRNLYRDLESAFPTLLMAVGQTMGSPPLSSSRVRALLSELALIRSAALPGVEIRGDGSIVFNPDFGAELQDAVEGLINTITAAVGGILDILIDPGAFLEGIYKLFYFVMMADLASRGYPPAVEYVSGVIGAIGRQLGGMAVGLSILQENMPEGAEFVRDVQRSVEWRIIWEIVGLFVGVGEALALIEAIRAGRAAEALADLARIGRGARALDAADEVAAGARLAEGTTDASRATHAVDETGDVGRGAARAEEATPTEVVPPSHATTTPSPAIPDGEFSMAGGRHRVGVRNGQISLCSGCGPLNDKLNHILDIIPGEIWYRRYYFDLRTEVRRLQRQFDAGVITQLEFEQQAQTLSARLDRLIQASDPNLGNLLALQVDELAEVAPGLRIQAQGDADRLGGVLDDFARSQREGRTRARESAGSGIPEDVDVPAHVETFPDTRGPATERGEWDGTPRNSEWTPTDDYVLSHPGLLNYGSIPFRDGYPDLSRFVVDFPSGGRAQVVVPRDVFLGGGRQPHFDYADGVFARRMDWRTPAGAMDLERVRAYRANQQLTWHHVEFDTILQLVPRPIHEAAQHAGGIATAGSL